MDEDMVWRGFGKPMAKVVNWQPIPWEKPINQKKRYDKPKIETLDDKSTCCERFLIGEPQSQEFIFNNMIARGIVGTIAGTGGSSKGYAPKVSFKAFMEMDPIVWTA